jgi:hypothetical protein
MTGTSKFMFGDHPLSLKLMAERVVSFRCLGYKATVGTEKFAGHTLHTLTVTAPERELSRSERGLLC